MNQVGIVAALTLLSLPFAARAQEATPPVSRVVPPNYYAQHPERILEHPLGRDHMESYPIPRDTITRETYMQWLEDSGCLDFANSPNRGVNGPAELLPVLAKYVQTHDAKWGNACVAMLKDFYRGLKEEVAKKGWTEQFVEPPAFLPLYHRYLIEGGLLDEKRDTWFRDMFLYYARNLHVWNDPSTFWRGPCHRTQSDGVVHGLAAKWYPDIPEAAEWRKYSDQVFTDFWDTRDVTENDTGYITDPLTPNLAAGFDLRGNDDFVTNPEMRKVWNRFLVEVTPDGAIDPYGPNGGWNSTAAWRIWLFEFVAARTGDGTYKYAAHKLMNYLLYQRDWVRKDRGTFVRDITERIALAWFYTDDKVAPVEPRSGSEIVYRKQVVRIHSKEDAALYLKDLDPAPNKAHICDNLLIFNEVVPSKLVFRSGWNPGDLYALVDLFIGADPLNPGGVFGLTRWGAPLTQSISAKGSADENRVIVEDLSGKAIHRYQATPHYTRGESWAKGGQSASTQVTVPTFSDLSLSTFATVKVTDYESLPVNVVRQFAFIKNRFLLIRDVVEFEQGFRASVGPVWNTQNIGPQLGTNWANSFLDAPQGNSKNVLYHTPPYDLLVYYAPKAGAQLQARDRLATDARTRAVPAQVGYHWEGDTRAGQKMDFLQVLYPHPPFVPGVNANLPGGESPELAATAGASGIKVLMDTPETTVVQLALDADRVEWVVFNPGGKRIKAGDLVTDAHFAYIDVKKEQIVGTNASGATYLALKDKEILHRNDRADFGQ
jgi:hypothetical protein